MKYLVIVEHQEPHESSYVIFSKRFDTLEDAVQLARVKYVEHEDDIVSIEVAGWRN